MSGNLRKKKKRSKWGADLDDQERPGEASAALAGDALEAQESFHGADHGDRNKLPEAVSRGINENGGVIKPDEAAGKAAPSCPTEDDGDLRKADAQNGWAGLAVRADANEAEATGVRSSFSLSFSRPSAKAKAYPPSQPPPVSGTPQPKPFAVQADYPGSGTPAMAPAKQAEAAAQLQSPLPTTGVQAVFLQPEAGSQESQQAVSVETDRVQAFINDSTVAPSTDAAKPMASVRRPESEQRTAPDEDDELPPGEEMAVELETTNAQVDNPTEETSEERPPGEEEEEPSPSNPPADTAASKPQAAEFQKEPCTLIVSSIRPAANEQSLRLLFESAGQVLGCKLVKDEATGAHKGFGFVMMASLAEAEAAAQKFNKFEWGDLRMQVTVKRPAKEEKPITDPVSTSATGGPDSGSLPMVPQSLPGPPAQSMAVSNAVGTSGPQEYTGLPSSLPIASAYGGYPMYDAYSYYGYEYGYGDPYAGYAGQPYDLPSGQDAQPSSEEERPPGLEDDEIPPGADVPDSQQHTAYQDYQEPVAAGETQAEAKADAGQEDEQSLAPPPPPAAPKKEPTVIHVPLKIPEGARKKQEERKKAREEKAKQQHGENGGVEAAANGTPAEDAPQPAKPAPVVLGTKGSFQEVLARRQAELAALKSRNSAARDGPAARSNKRNRSLSRSPPPRYRRSTSRSRSRAPRSPFRGGARGPRRRPFGRSSRSPSYSRSPLRSYSRSYSRSPSPSRSYSYSRSPSRYSYSGSDDMDQGQSPLQSPKKKVKTKKEKKRKQKKEKKRRDKDVEQSPAVERGPARDSFMLPPRPPDGKPAPGWVEVDPHAPRREIRLPSPPLVREPPRTAEPAVFRQPARKRPRTRWHGEGSPSRGTELAGDSTVEGEQDVDGREEGEADLRGTRDAPAKDEAVAQRKPSPQVSEEGEIALEEGEIEGEILEEESEPPPVAKEPNRGNAPAYDDYSYDDRHRGWDRQHYFGGPGRGRGRGRGGRGNWGYGHDTRIAETRAW